MGLSVVIKGEEKKEFTWSTSVDTATLDAFKLHVCVEYPKYANVKALEILYYPVSSKITTLTNDQDLREQLKTAKMSSQKKFTVSFGTPNKSFSSWTLKEVCEVYEITSGTENPSYRNIPAFTGIKAAPLRSDLEKKKALAKLKEDIAVFVDVMILVDTNEATKSLVYMFLANATRPFKQDMRLGTQLKLTGCRGNGPVDFSVHSREDRSYTLGVTEVKNEKFDRPCLHDVFSSRLSSPVTREVQSLFNHLAPAFEGEYSGQRAQLFNSFMETQGMAQNLVQLDAAALTQSKKRELTDGEELVTRSYGVVADASHLDFHRMHNGPKRKCDLQEDDARAGDKLHTKAVGRMTPNIFSKGLCGSGNR